MAEAAPPHDNILDIELANRTLVLLGELAQNGLLPPSADIRSLAANLCHYQDHWATPIFNPMLGRKDFEKPLPRARPFPLLEQFNAVVPISADDISKDEEDEPAWKGIVEENGQNYVVVGGKEWKRLVESGKISGDNAKAPVITVFSWLKDLFEIFHWLAKADQLGSADTKGKGKGKGAAKGKGKATEGETDDKLEKLKEIARNLAGCWYYTATEVDFDEEEGDDDEEEDEEEGEEGEEGDDEEDEDEDDEEEEEEDEEEEGEEEEKKEEKEEAKEEKKEGETADDDKGTDEPSSKRHKSETPTKSEESKSTDEGASGSSKGKKEKEEEEESSDDDDFDPDEMSDEDVPPEEYDDNEEEGEREGEREEFIGSDDEIGESEGAREIREAILQGVEALGAYLPNPAVDPVFFKRMIIKMKTIQAEAPEEFIQLWFPLGADYTIFLNLPKE